MQLVVISAPEAVAHETDKMRGLLDAGLRRLHLRKPGFSAGEMASIIEQLPARYHARLVLHGHPALVSTMKLGGLHLTAAARTSPSSRPKLATGQTLSTSFHTLADVRQHRRKYDYVFLSPIFDSLSKSGYAAGFELSTVAEALRHLRQRTGYVPQVLALGGIEAEKLAAVRQAGFAGAAVLGAMWQSPDPVAAFRELQALAG
ncbi:thiamine phosphate synthase [Hymenobacter properus]|uniref:Thiamine phosphate synthase n=1 Tax=Hymenobacter properus TaxID=2791026 RepID=A0A931FHV4_9BACT|nr:thiamine phosphate synthase [Hymenobacter properus]MBF9141432.1 thiamine phosphate synthase [Hymenobacter properus]MBR7720241.1 thiamine phosphate synthase [Microvirga sp. SRT04]